MPWRQEWYPAPTDPNLPVYPALPNEYETNSWALGRVVHAWLKREHWRDRDPRDLPDGLHYCHHCGGWIPGGAYEAEVYDLSPHTLSGRRGTEYYCRRCGRRIDFVGMMS